MLTHPSMLFSMKGFIVTPRGFLGGTVIKNLSANIVKQLFSSLKKKESTCQYRICGFDPWLGKIPWRRKRQPTPVFLPGEFHGQRSLVGDSP